MSGRCRFLIRCVTAFRLPGERRQGQKGGRNDDRSAGAVAPRRLRRCSPSPTWSGFRVVNLPSALIAVLVIGFLNMTLGLLLKAITFPFAILTLGLFFLVINAIMLIICQQDHSGLHIDSFGAALIGAGSVGDRPPDY